MMFNLKRSAILLSTALLSTVLAEAVAETSFVKDGVWYHAGEANPHQEVALFGANYNMPFAFGYRSVKALGLSHEDVIRMDVAHLARLGVTAYRIHLWDRLISDKEGNLLNNTHLALFDFLMAELQRYNIKTVLTPIGWWGSGYPAPDPAEPGFAALFTKNQMNELPVAIAAQQRYLSQLMAHKNLAGIPYAKDPNILAFELFNEPKHANAAAVTDYVNSLVEVMREAGVTQPLFYNTSEQGNWPEFAQALCESAIDGVSFQWYPTGLLKYSSLQSNVLSSVAHYHNPFAELSACANKAKLIYEFDAADVTSPLLYPAMARSFRSAGFQWATQFAYDSAALGASNAEYNTHFLNLLYTPAKAISFLIAGDVFRHLPRGFVAKPYPESNQFGNNDFTVQLDPSQNLALLNAKTRFYHTNTTLATPLAETQLHHIAGVGSSSLVSYHGSGAYFLDKYDDGLWLLEVYPDVITLEDPHQNSSLQREAVRLAKSRRDMTIHLAELGKEFIVTATAPSSQPVTAQNGKINIIPGRYWLRRSEDIRPNAAAQQALVTRPFVLPSLTEKPAVLAHEPLRQWPIDQPLPLCAQVAGVPDINKITVSVFYQLAGEGPIQRQAMQPHDQGRYCIDLALPDRSGLLQYQLVISDQTQHWSFPNAIAASPAQWDFPHNAANQYTTLLQQPGAAVPLFDAKVDQSTLLYPKDAQVTQQWLAGDRQQGLALRLRPAKTADWQRPPLALLRTETHLAMGLTQRDLTTYNRVAIKMRAVSAKMPVRFSLLNADGLAFGIDLEATTEWRYQLVPLSALQATPTLLTQAFPTFMPASLEHSGAQLGNLSQLQGTQWQLLAPTDGNNALEIAEVSLIR